MSLNLVSPGVKVREVDLTIGNITGANEQVGAFAAPFAKGPVGVPQLIESEQDLIKTFGEPSGVTTASYEYWMCASSYLSYGGVLRVVRADDANMTNANVSAEKKGIPQGVDGIVTIGINETLVDATSGIQGDTLARFNGVEDPAFKLEFDVLAEGSTFTIGITTTAPHTPTVELKTAGIGLKDNQVITVSPGALTSAASTTIGVAVTFSVNGVQITGAPGVKINSFEDYSDNQSNPTEWFVAARNPGSWGNGLKVCAIDGRADQIIGLMAGGVGVAANFTDTNLVGLGVTQSLVNRKVPRDDGTVETLTKGYLRGVITDVSTVGGVRHLEVKVVDKQELSGDGTTYVSTPVDYAEGSVNSFVSTSDIMVFNSVGVGSTAQTISGTSGVIAAANIGYVKDWYDEQTLGLTNSKVFWKSIAEKPSTSEYASQRSARNDEIHYVVVDDDGSVTGTAGNILEKHLNLSKAKDAVISPSQNIYYRDYIATGSQYIFAGAQPTDEQKDTGFVSGGITPGFTLSGKGNWTSNAQGTIFAGIGATSYRLEQGNDYNSTLTSKGNFDASLGSIIGAYDKFSTVSEYDINFLIMGPAAGSDDETSAKARKLIAIAEERKDCIACISPPRSAVVNVADSDTQTTNLIKFFDPLPSSSYAVFDSGYKYAFNRFNNEFRYIPMNPDIAGLMARTSIDQFSWFSPAGAARGSINGAIKLAYNPSKAQRDAIYPKRINPVIASPGAGIILFGDKTGLGYASAFDRINVRRLFLTIESTIERAARDQLFEFNDIITRSSFLNVVDPYLRDVKAKRGITDYVVICDETNNTPDIIDSNQFRADIFVKPNRSINFIGLSFVATRTGVSFEEVVGNV